MPKLTDSVYRPTSYPEEVGKIALHVAAGAALQVAESLLPHPLPGARLGLANVITLLVLMRYGTKEALRVALLRTFIASLIMGTFLSPTFILSLSGALFGTAVMAWVYYIARATPVRFSLVGISVAGAVAHTTVQVVIVYFLFVRSPAVIAIWPLLLLLAVGAGILTGVIANKARGIEQKEPVLSIPNGRRQRKDIGDRVESSKQNNWLCRLPATGKLAVTFTLAGIAILVTDYRVYTALFVLLLLIAALGRVNLIAIVRDLNRLSLFLLVVFLTPILFHNWGRLVLSLGPLRITSPGLTAGGIFTARVLILFFLSSLLNRSTSPPELALSLARFLSPLRRLGSSPEKLVAIANLSWQFFPILWERGRRLIFQFRKQRGGLVRLSAELTAAVYQMAEEIDIV